MIVKMHALPVYGLMLALALVFSGCAVSQQEIMARDHLAKTWKAYNQAKADPTVKAHASGSLMDAEKTLEDAEQARDFNEMNHLIYMAEREVQIATAIARIKAARQKSGELRAENDQMLKQLNARALSTEDPEAAKKEERAAAEVEREEGTPPHD